MLNAYSVNTILYEKLVKFNKFIELFEFSMKNSVSLKPSNAISTRILTNRALQQANAEQFE